MNKKYRLEYATIGYDNKEYWHEENRYRFRTTAALAALFASLGRFYVPNWRVVENKTNKVILVCQGKDKVLRYKETEDKHVFNSTKAC